MRVRTAALHWDRFWFSEGPTHGLAAFRILFGAYCLLRWLSLLPHVPLFFSGQGLYFPFFEAPAHGFNSLGDLLGWISSPVSIEVAWVLYSATLLLLVLAILGLWTKTVLTLYLASFLYHYLLYFHMQNTSYDRLAVIFLALLLLSPCARVWSLDSRRARRRGAKVGESAVLWTQKLICMQVAIMYLGTGLFKISFPVWSSGEVLHSAMMSDWGTWLSFWILGLGLSMGWFDLGVLLTKVFEISAGPLLFHPRLKWLVFAAGFVFHLSIALLLNLWQFMLMPLTYVLFVDPARVREWVDGWVSSRSPAPAAVPFPTVQR